MDRVRRKLKVLFATAEAVPFVKTGGLGDVSGSLPKALRHAGCKVAVILPKYGSIPQEYVDKMEHIADFYVPLSWRNCYCGVEKLTHGGTDFYFIDNEGYFKRDAPYGYFDDGERFAFFSKAVTECIQQIPELECDVLHCNDWQTALAPVFLREFYKDAPWYDRVKTVFTIHNVKFQGQYSEDLLHDVLGLDQTPAADQLRMVDMHGNRSINYMKGACLYCDTISTVSPTYAQELMTPFFGEGLDGIFRDRSWCLHGILNGIDVDEFNPATDDRIAEKFTAETLEKKAEDKRALQEELGLDQDPTRPLVAMVGRLTSQKGMGLVTYAMDRLMSRGVQVAILGTGDSDIEDSLRYFDWKYNNQMRAIIAFDNNLAHRMYAGADLFLMPSEFEPCGLSQMIAMRYGTLPVVRETGGLVDSVQAYNQYTGEGTGFRFANINGDEMADVLLNACEVFWTQPEVFKQLQLNAMAEDFSWHKAAEDYIDMYQELHPEVIRYNKRR